MSLLYTPSARPPARPPARAGGTDRSASSAPAAGGAPHRRAARAGSIGIMVHGALRADGSPLELKAKYGLGYRLHVARTRPEAGPILPGPDAADSPRLLDLGPPEDPAPPLPGAAGAAGGRRAGGGREAAQRILALAAAHVPAARLVRGVDLQREARAPPLPPPTTMTLRNPPFAWGDRSAYKAQGPSAAPRGDMRAGARRWRSTSARQTRARSRRCFARSRRPRRARSSALRATA